MKEFGRFLKENRIKSGYKSQRELAKISRISAATISRLEAGVHEPTLETLNVLSDYLTSTTLNEMIRKLGNSVGNNEVTYWKERALNAEREVIRLRRIIDSIKQLTSNVNN